MLCGAKAPTHVLSKVFNGAETLYIVMELVKGGNIYDLIVRPMHYSESVASRMLHNLMSAVAYMHENRVAHCDLKPENILLENVVPRSRTEIKRNPHVLTQIKVADFGFARVVGERDDLTRWPCFLPTSKTFLHKRQAPEVL